MQYQAAKPILHSFGSMVVLLLFIATAVSAQTFRGTILGTVTDPNGALVSGAKITVKNTSTGLERSTKTDDAGNYTVAELPIGRMKYALSRPASLRQWFRTLVSKSQAIGVLT